MTIDQTLSMIRPVSAEALAAAQLRQDNLTKPPGSLGVLERIGVQLAGIHGSLPAPVPGRAVVGVFAGDHGVCAQGVSPWPQEVTVQMLGNMAAGGAAVTVLAKAVDCEVVLTDVGVQADYPAHPAIRDRRVRRSTGDFTRELAMTREQAEQAVQIGIDTAFEAVDQGAEILLIGELGIGNTTPASALIGLFTGSSIASVTGHGSGADDAMVAAKVDAITRAFGLHRPDAADPIGALSAIGGLEHAAMAGFILGAAARGVPLILDGVIACSAALVAVAMAPDAKGYLIAGHAGQEPGITAAIAALGLTPLVDLELRLGEGSGAVVALPIVRAAARVLSDMATFDEVGIAH